MFDKLVVVVLGLMLRRLPGGPKSGTVQILRFHAVFVAMCILVVPNVLGQASCTCTFPA